MSDTTSILAASTTPATKTKPVVHVAVGVVLRDDGALLLGQRPNAKPWPGWWELPGGKIEPGESVREALVRELQEELEIDVLTSTPWVTYVHEYPKNFVRLEFQRVTEWRGEPIGAEGQALAWVYPRQALAVGPLLPATAPPLRWLQLPERYLITSIGQAANLPSFLKRLEATLKRHRHMVQFREPQWAEKATIEEVREGFLQVLDCCRRYGAPCLVNSLHPESWRELADGVHWRETDARALVDAAGAKGDRPRPALRPGRIATNRIDAPTADEHLQHWPLVGVSAHGLEGLKLAERLDADFAVVGHVLETPSHPCEPALGWSRFQEVAQTAGRPVFAIGGQSEVTFQTAQEYGAHGIAGIRGLLAAQGSD